jgi:NADPH-dependent 2,4-dienoyl-CoA reductase/sulfur reductase-like enzyme
MIRQECEVLVVGGGPAGIAAVCAAREGGLATLVVDDGRKPGGQIWRSGIPSPWKERWRRAGCTMVVESRVVAQPESGVVLVESPDCSRVIRYRKLILSPGARERFLPFPGWTLPNVMGAGGLQALVKSGLPIEGKQVVVAGSGPLLVAVAAYLRDQGARVALIAEQASWGRLVRFAPAVMWDGSKLAQSVRLAGIRYTAGCWPVRADLEGVVLRRGDKTWHEPCDYLACGFGLTPNLELPLLLGCGVERGSVTTNEWQQTTAPEVYYAGELGGVELALAEGEIAGHAAAGRLDEARRKFAARARARRFKAAMDRAFALREELKSLATPETIVCRCEDVTLAQLAGQRDWRSAKLETRCGMGPCQGRVCGAALEYLLGWAPDSVRPPVYPARVDTLLVAQSFHGVESGRLGRGPNAEKQADSDRHSEPKRGGPNRHAGGDVGEQQPYPQ